MIKQLNLIEMLSLCVQLYDKPTHQLVVIGHELREEFEYIDFMDLDEGESARHPTDLSRHRLRRIHGPWELIY